MKKQGLIAAVLSAAVLSACGQNGAADVTESAVTYTETTETVTETVTEAVTEPVTEPVTEAEAEQTTTAQTASAEDLRDFSVGIDFCTINIPENASGEEIMRAGETAAVFYSKGADPFFSWGAYYCVIGENGGWKCGDWIHCEEADARSDGFGYMELLGFYTDKANNVYVPMDFEQVRAFVTENLYLTERGFEELGENSPCEYRDFDGVLGIRAGDGGDAGWSFSRIVGYEMNGDTVTYNCERVGSAEEWGYDEDLIEPFTFTLKREDGVWKLDGCTYGEGLFDFSAFSFSDTTDGT